MKKLILLIALLLISISSFKAASQTLKPNESIVFVAHRGGIVPGCPENTLMAYRQAIVLGVNAIEIDLRGTKDGAVIIMHDETVDRTTNGSGKVIDITLAEIRKLDAGKGEQVPTFEEVLKLVANTGVSLLLDIKESPVLDKHKVVQLTETYNSVRNVIVGARNLEDLSVFKALNPDLHTLGFIKEVGDIEQFVEAGINIIRLWPEWIYADHSLIGKVHSLGKPVWTTAGEAQKEELDKLIKLGVNGILSDLPELINSFDDRN